MFVDFFFPPHCVACGKIGHFLCADCLRKSPRILPPFCKKCGKPEVTGNLCPTCWGWQSKIDGIRAPFRFEGVIRQAIHEFKYHNLRAMSSCLAELLFAYLESNPISAEVLVSVPLHHRRLRQRGYNQSALLAEELGKLTGLPVIEDCLCRLKNSPPQTRTVTADNRRRNVVDVFTCRDQRLSGRHVLLVDDVCTSGATLEACATALKSTGVLSVWGLTLAEETSKRR